MSLLARRRRWGGAGNRQSNWSVGRFAGLGTPPCRAGEYAAFYRTTARSAEQNRPSSCSIEGRGTRRANPENVAADRLPSRADFSDADLRPYFGHILIVDFVGGQRRFRFRLLGTSLADAAGRELTGKYFDEADISGYEPDVLDDYDEAVRLRAPFCKVRRFNPRADVYADHWKSYERLLLPLAGNGQDIDKMLGCSYPLGELG